MRTFLRAGAVALVASLALGGGALPAQAGLPAVAHVTRMPDTPDPAATKYFLGEWKKRGFNFAGATESFRGYDGIRTIAHGIEKAGKADPAAIKDAMWKVDYTGLNGKIKFEKQGPSGRESGQSIPNVYLIKIDDGKISLPKL